MTRTAPKGAKDDGVSRPSSTPQANQAAGSVATGDEATPRHRFSRHSPAQAFRSLVARGVSATVLGVLLLFSSETLSRLTTFVAAYWILSALLTVRWARANPFEPHHRITLAAGVVAFAAGATVILRPLYSPTLSVNEFLDVLGATAIAMGLMSAAGWIHDDQVGGRRVRRRYRYVLGTLEVLLGFALILATEGASTQVRVVLGLWGILTGSFLLLDAVALRQRAKSPEAVG
jgi:uncharacterized membrane protein HdeD (DUF308 family)